MRLPCPSPSPGICSNSCPLSQWCHLTVHPLSPFSSSPQSCLRSRSFPLSWLFASGGQSIGASASASVLPGNIQDRFLLGLTALISLQSKGLSKIFSNTPVQKHGFFGSQPSLWSNCSPSMQMPRVCTSNWHAVPPGQTRRSAGGGYVRGGGRISTYTARPLFHEDKFPPHHVESCLWLTTINDLESMKVFMLTLPSQYAASGQGSGPHSLNRTC